MDTSEQLDWLVGPDEVRCAIPKRSTTATGLVGSILIGAAALIGSWPILAAAMFASVGFDNERALSDVLAPLVFFGVFCFPVAGFLIFKGLLLLRGRDEIVIREDRISAVTRWGPLKSSRHCQLEDLGGFRIERSFESEDSVGFLHGMASLVAIGKQTKSIHLLRLYPEEVIRELATSLDDQIESFTARRGRPIPKELGVEEISLDPSRTEARTEKPIESDIVCEQKQDGLVIRLPAKGWRRTTGCFLKVWSIFWVSMTLLMTALLLPALIGGTVKGDASAGWVLMVVFWISSIALVFYLDRAAKRRGTITLTPSHLRFDDAGLFRAHHANWTRARIESVGVAAEKRGRRSPRWIHSIHVSPNHATEHDWFSNREKPELEWIATKLTEALGLDSNGEH